jgi:hypothetical protein
MRGAAGLIVNFAEFKLVKVVPVDVLPERLT